MALGARGRRERAACTHACTPRHHCVILRPVRHRAAARHGAPAWHRCHLPPPTYIHTTTFSHVSRCKKKRLAAYQFYRRRTDILDGYLLLHGALATIPRYRHLPRQRSVCYAHHTRRIPLFFGWVEHAYTCINTVHAAAHLHCRIQCACEKHSFSSRKINQSVAC